mgnify:CR=1 FL=1
MAKNISFTIKYWKQNGPQDQGHFDTHEMKNIPDDTSFLEMLDILNEELIASGDEPFVFDHDCREGICGMCSLYINGTPHGKTERGATTCQLYMRRFNDGDIITVEPWRSAGFPVIKDCMVDRSAFDKIIQAGGYTSIRTGQAQDANAILIPKEDADEAMDCATCIGCGACVAACKNGSAMLFVSSKVSQLALLPQGKPEAAKRAKAMVAKMDEVGFGNCTNTRACEAVCPKNEKIANIARLNRAPLPRPRDLVGALRTVVFSPMDLAIVRGDPSDRRAWLDTLVTTRWPRMAGVRADLDKILRQRNSLLKAMSGKSLRQSTPEEDVTLQAWNDALARIGAELLHARLDTLADVLPHAAGAYETIAPVNNRISALYKTSLDLAGIPVDAVRETLEARLLDAMTERRREEVARGVTLVGPQRDDITLSIGELPAKGYASHGESWSLALALKLGGFALVRSDGIEPVLVLDDVFSELDAIRRERLAGAVADAEQVLITAAVGADVPDFPSARRFRVQGGAVEPVEELEVVDD